MERIAHIDRHSLTPEEVDEILADNNNRLYRCQDGVYLLYGRTVVGRRLLVVILEEPGRVGMPITARDLTKSERRRYFND